MLAVDIDSHDSLVEIGVGRLKNSIIDMIKVAQSIKSLEHKLEQCLQVLWVRRRNENVAITMGNRSSNRNTKGCGFSSSSGSSQCDSVSKRLFGNRVNECEERLGLVNGSRQTDQRTDRLRFCQAFLDFLQFLL